METLQLITRTEFINLLHATTSIDANELDQAQLGNFHRQLTTHLQNRVYEMSQLDHALAPVGNSAWGEAYQHGWGDGTHRLVEIVKGTYTED